MLQRPRSCHMMALGLAVLVAGCGSSGPGDGIGSSVFELTNTATYESLQASITVPELVAPDTNFDLSVFGEIIGGNAFSVSAFRVYENASWTYDANHMVSVASGTLIDASGFNWGNVDKTYVLNKPGGGGGACSTETHAYTFVYGFRDSGHGWYDLAVDASVAVGSGSAPIAVTVSQVQLFPNGAEKILLQGELTLPANSGFDPKTDGLAVRVYLPNGGQVYPTAAADVMPVSLDPTADGWAISGPEKTRAGIESLMVQSTDAPNVLSFKLVDTQFGLTAQDYSNITVEVVSGCYRGSVDVQLAENNGKFTL